jgi:hypothetical protein
MKYAILVFFLFCIIACSRNPKTGDNDIKLEKIKINLTDSSTKYVEDIMDSIKVVTLTAGKDFSFGDQSNYFFSDSVMIITARMQGSVFIFDRSGKLLNTIKTSHAKNSFKQGDFNTITDVFYDDHEKLIEILDRTSSKIFRFNTNGGIKDTLFLADTRALGYQFARSKNEYVSILLNHNVDRRGIGLYKKDGQVLRYNAQKLTKIPYLKYINILYPHQLDVFKDSVYYFPMLEDKIYNVTAEKGSPAYLLDYPERNKLPRELRDAEPTKDYYAYDRKMVSSKIIYNNSSLFINNDWVSFRFNFQTRNSPRNVFYNKKTKKVLQFSNLATKTGMAIFPHANIIGKYKNYFIMISDAPKKVALNGKTVNRGNFKLLFFKLKDI